MRTPRLIAFDLDDTLAPSKSALDPEMVFRLSAVVQEIPVCIISGGRFEQFSKQVIAPLVAAPRAGMERLHLMPACGTQYYRFIGGAWVRIYSEDLRADEKVRALAVIEQEARRLGYWETETWGPILEDRESQITFSALGQSAPVAAKSDWDPTGAKKNALRAAVQAALPELDVRSGGSTSIDVTRRGVDKAYGMRRLAELTGIPLTGMLFIGDRLDVDGNDYPVVATGVRTRAVAGWRETLRVLDGLLPSLTSANPRGAADSSV